MQIGLHPKLKKAWLEVVLYRTLRVCQVYLLTSFGRRFYRTLKYSSDARFSLSALQPPTADRRQPWPAVPTANGPWQWSRHEAS